MKSFLTFIFVLFMFNICNAQNVIETDLKTTEQLLIKELDLENKSLNIKVEDTSKVKKRNFNWFTTIDAESFWASVEQTRPVLISGSTDGKTGSLFTELVSDRLGLTKFTFASVLSGSSDNSSETNLQTFLSGGGNAILKADFPVFYWANLKQGNNSNNMFMALYFMPRLSTILPALGSSSDKTECSADIGTELQFGIKTINKKIGLMARVRISETIVTDTFKEELGTGRSFFYSQASLNFKLESYNIYVNIPFSFADKTDLPVTISVGTTF